MNKFLAWSAFLLLSLGACKNSSEPPKDASEYLPEANGEVGKIAMLVDDATYNVCKNDLDSVFERPVEGMPAIEPYFRITRCSENNFIDYFKYNYHLCVVYQKGKKEQMRPVLGDKLIELIDQKIEKGESVFVLKDVFAKPQEVTFVIANNDQELKENIEHNADLLFDLAQKTERKTTINVIIRGNVAEDEFYNYMMRKYGYGVRTPTNYKVSVRSDEFNGINKDLGEKRAGLYIYEEDYKGEQQFTRDYIIQRRNEMLKKHLHGPDRPDSIPTYVTTDTVNVSLFTKKTEVNGFMAVETRGWWEMENEFFGGPFLSYTVYCPTINKVVTLEGNVFAPGEKKQKYLKQLELAISTFELKK